MNSVCLDTCVLIFALQDQVDNHRSELATKARRLLTHLNSTNRTIIVPAIVLGEFLLGLPEEEWGRTISFFQQNFIVIPYDVGCAQHFARLWQEREKDGTIDDLKNDGNTRTKLRADCMIIATFLNSNLKILARK